MELTEMMFGSVQFGRDSTEMQIDTFASRKSDKNIVNKAFGNILESRINKVDYRQNSVSRNDVTKTDDSPKYLSFREANKSNMKAYAQRSTDGDKAKLREVRQSLTNEVKSDKKTALNENLSGDLLHVFAQVLGVDINDLQKLLKEADVTSEELNSMESITENVNRLSEVLGLNSEQQDPLAKMLQMTFAEISSITETQTDSVHEATLSYVIDSSISAKSEDSQQPSDIIGNGGAPAENSLFESIADKLNLKIKEKLDELTFKLQTDDISLQDELKQLIQPLLEKKNLKTQQQLQQIVSADAGDNSEQVIAVADADAKTMDSEDDATGNGAKTDNETVIQQPISVIDETTAQEPIAAILPDQISGTKTIESAAGKTTIAAKEIVNQVIENAKVILTPDKSEMVMDLKPDSLGRISLKVITENGIVMAKFVAESQQVKEVLEANMQLLKDSLEKQGIGVEGFSVSVRQEANQSSRDWEKFQHGRKSNYARETIQSGVVEGSLISFVGASGSSNPYQWGNSTINLTA